MNIQGDKKVAQERILCTVDDFARAALLHVQEMGRLVPATAHESGRERLDSLLFLAPLSGEGTVRYGRVSRPLRAGECALIDCNGGYGHATGTPPWRLLWVHFNGPGARAMATRWREKNGGAIVRATAPERYFTLWDELRGAVATSGLHGQFRVNGLLADIFSLLASDATAAAGDYRAKRLSAVMEWINAHFAEAVTLDDLASVAHLNKFTLSREFSARYGIPPSRAVAQARVANAKRLLRFTQETVEEIGAKCGVPDPNYFARLFRRVEGVSPRAFRNQWRPGGAARTPSAPQASS